MTNRRASPRAIRRSLGAVCLVVIGLLAQGCIADSAPTVGSLAPDVNLNSAPTVGSLAPDFNLTDLDGDTLRLSDLRGQVVVLNFWATWCVPCRAEMPEIEAVHQEYRDQGVVIIGIDLRETPDEVRRYIEHGGYTWRFAIDTTGEVAKSYRVSAIPASFFIDARGIIRAVAVGALTRGGMESRLMKAMNPE